MFPSPAALQPNVKLFTSPGTSSLGCRQAQLAEGSRPLQVPGGNSRPWWYSLHRKQDLWKLLPSHWTSSAKYTVFWHTPHFLPPPQFGILEKNTKIRMRRGDENRLPTAGRPPRGWSVLGEYFRLVLKTRLQSLLADVCVGRVRSSYLILFTGEAAVCWPYAWHPIQQGHKRQGSQRTCRSRASQLASGRRHQGASQRTTPEGQIKGVCKS